jgi:hypothetical protein
MVQPRKENNGMASYIFWADDASYYKYRWILFMLGMRIGYIL